MSFRGRHLFRGESSMKLPICLCSIFVFLCAGLCARSSAAQQNVTSATLSGRVEDAQGAVVSGASLMATHIETNQQLTATTDHDGRYRFPYLRTGAYDLKVDAQGFSTITKQLTVSVGQSLDLPIRLEVAGVSAQVNIGSRVLVFQKRGGQSN